MDKVYIDEESFKKLLLEIKTLRSICTDPMVTSRLENLLKTFESFSNSKRSSILEIIEKELAETKRTNADLNAKLYILHQDLKRGKISEEEVLEIFESHLRHKKYNTMIY